MLEAKSLDVMHFRGRGEAFTEFVDALIRVQAQRGGVSESALHTNLRVSQRDGGVDTQVDLVVPGDLTGTLSTRSVWQYKARGHADISNTELVKEVNAPYAKIKIGEGYAYRLAIADDLPPEKKTEWELLLTSEARKINTASPPALVVSASGLAAWVTRFPGRVLRFFRPPGPFMHAEALASRARAVTRQFVSIPGWASVAEAVTAHCDFKMSPPSPVLLIRGASGVGKTRLVCETLSKLPGLGAMILYSDSPSIVDSLGFYLANNENVSCILIADDAAPSLRWRMSELFQGCVDRVRVIAMDNAFATDATAWMYEVQLQPMRVSELKEVMSQNFPIVPSDVLDQYAQMTDGFVRIAADLCSHYGRAGMTNGAPPSIEAYLDARTPTSAREALLALSLFAIVGFEGDKAFELESMCTTLGLGSTVSNRATLLGLKEAPGFVATRGRYLAVTPEIVASVFFARAWGRWAQADPASFIAKLPPELQLQFHQRVAQSAGQEVRRVVATFLRSWSHELTAEELRSADITQRLVTFIDTDPDVHLPALVKILESASDAEVAALSGTAERGWGPRRHLVWLCERMASLTPFFELVERALLRLAVNETENSIGNNATRIWCQLFRIYLSGTPEPFTQRAEVLRRRVESDEPRVARLAVEAASAALSPLGMRLGNRDVVAGRRVPREWQPLDSDEYRRCLDALTAMLATTAAAHRGPVSALATRELIKQVPTLLSAGQLVQLRQVLKPPVVDDALIAEILDKTELFVASVGGDQQSVLVDQIADWQASLLPNDLHGRLLRAVGQRRSHMRVEGDSSDDEEFRSLAAALLSDSGAMQRELPWLSTTVARSAGDLGVRIGELDADLSMLPAILNAALSGDSTALARGYVFGVSRTRADEQLQLVAAEIDRLEISAPRLAFDLALAGGTRMRPVDRALEMVRVGRLPSSVLTGHLVWDRSIVTVNDYERILESVLVASTHHDDSGIVDALSMLENWLRKDSTLLDGATMQALAWNLMEVTMARDGTNGWHWEKILQLLAEKDPHRAIQLALAAFLDEKRSYHKEAESLLTQLAPQHSELVMDELGRAMLSERGWIFSVERHNGLIAALPVDVVRRWIERAGVEGARRIARHLPEPFLGGADGQTPDVPELTSFVLTAFENDERTFREFVAGFHSMQWYSGDIAAQHLQEAEHAKKFAAHPLRRIREWARIEERSARAEADRWKRYEEEREI